MSGSDGTGVASGAVQVEPSDAAAIEPAAWAARVAEVAAVLTGEGVDTTDLAEAAGALVLVDEAGVSWRHDGTRWERRDGSRWTAGTPTHPLRLQPFTLDLPLAPDAEFPEDDPAAMVEAHGAVPPSLREKVYARARRAGDQLASAIRRRR